MQNKPRFYYPELDGLRFIAFLLVFIHNAPNIESSSLWTALHEYGWIGVDLFFCLSGFLITKLLVAEHQHKGTINIRNFYIRRILRIWPLYYLYILIGLLFIMETQGWIQVIPKHIAGLATLTYNFAYLFLTHKVFVVYFHLWTISYEEQFYALIPWVLRKFIRNTQQMNWVYIFTILIFGNFIRAVLIYFKVIHPVVYMLPFTHFEAMLGGIAIGLGLFDSLLRTIQSWIILLFGAVINATVFLLPNTYEIGWNLMITYPLVGIGMTSIVLGVMKSDSSLIIKLLRNEVLVYLGKISFGLYIFHLLCLSIVILIVRRVSGLTSTPTTIHQIVFFIGGLILTILFSITSYRFFEKPFLNLKARYGFVSSRPI